jgi:hypothetical protein
LKRKDISFQNEKSDLSLRSIVLDVPRNDGNHFPPVGEFPPETIPIYSCNPQQQRLLFSRQRSVLSINLIGMDRPRDIFGQQGVYGRPASYYQPRHDPVEDLATTTRTHDPENQGNETLRQETDCRSTSTSDLLTESGQDATEKMTQTKLQEKEDTTHRERNRNIARPFP